MLKKIFFASIISILMFACSSEVAKKDETNNKMPKEVKVDMELRTVYIIRGKGYYYYNFEIII